MTNWSDSSADKKLVTLAVSGASAEQWAHLQGKIMKAIEGLTDRLMAKLETAPQTSDETKAVVRDVATIAADWARAKIERPSLENDQIRADIAVKYTEAKKNLAETEKTLAETAGIKLDNELKAVRQGLENMERALEILLKARQANISFTTLGEDAHLLIGPAADQVRPGLPSGPEQIEGPKT